MLNPFSNGFKVTPKGTTSDRFYFNWKLASPLIFFFIITTVSLWQNLGICLITANPETALQIKGISLGWIWSFYNLIMISIALLILLDVPKPNLYEWFNLRRLIRLDIAGQSFWGVTTSISEIGANVALTQAGLPAIYSEPTLPINLEIMEEAISLQAQVTSTGFNGEFPTVQIIFDQLTLAQQRKLVEILFCRPGQWKRQKTPGELRSLWLLLKILLKPQVLFGRNAKISAIAVSQV